MFGNLLLIFTDLIYSELFDSLSSIPQIQIIVSIFKAYGRYPITDIVKINGSSLTNHPFRNILRQ
jgi:hypothetical protein